MRLIALWMAGAGLAANVAGQTASTDLSGRAEAYYNYILARQAWSRQDYPAAVAYLERVIHDDANAVEPLLELARLHSEVGALDRAAEAARRAVAVAPESPAARRLLADLLMASSMKEEGGPAQLDEAIAAYREVIKLEPDEPEALLNLGKLLITRAALPEALEMLKRHLAASPGSEEGNYLAAQVLVELSRAQEAETLLTTAIDANPDRPLLRAALMETFEAEGKLEEAVGVGTELLRFRGDQLRVRFALARLNQKLGRRDETLTQLREAQKLVDRRPQDYSTQQRAEMTLRIVQLMIESGHADEALTLAETGEKRFPEDERFMLKKGEALLAEKRQDEAEELFKERMRAEDGRAREDLVRRISESYLSAGARRERGGDVDGAEVLLKRAIDLNPGNAAALNYLGYMLADRNVRVEEAITLIKRALEKEPNNGAYLDSLGWAYFRKGDYSRAEKALGSALTNMPDEPAIHAHLGDLYSATGRLGEAITAWRGALDRGVENPGEIRAKLAAAEKAVQTSP